MRACVLELAQDWIHFTIFVLLSRLDVFTCYFEVKGEINLSEFRYFLHLQEGILFSQKCQRDLGKI